MKRLITMLLLGTAMSFGSLQAIANEPTLNVGIVDVIALSTEQAQKLIQERAMYEAALEMVLSSSEQRAGQSQNLEKVNIEYQRRIEGIVNNEEPAHYRTQVRAPGIIY